jgi:hypothetical protein
MISDLEQGLLPIRRAGAGLLCQVQFLSTPSFATGSANEISEFRRPSQCANDYLKYRPALCIPEPRY